jgi:hypothetical protein
LTTSWLSPPSDLKYAPTPQIAQIAGQVNMKGMIGRQTM